MHLNHIDLPVSNVHHTAAFFERWFGFELIVNETASPLVIMRGTDGFSLVLQSRRGGDAFPEGFHVGFVVEDDAALVAFHARAQAEQLRIGEIQRTSRGSVTYLYGPDELLIEVSVQA